MKKPVKIIFSVVLSVAMVLSLALTAYGASSLTSDFAVTVEKGKVFDENGDLYTGWYIKNRLHNEKMLCGLFCCTACSGGITYEIKSVSELPER